MRWLWRAPSLAALLVLTACEPTDPRSRWIDASGQVVPQQHWDECVLVGKLRMQAHKMTGSDLRTAAQDAVDAESRCLRTRGYRLRVERR